MGRFRDLTGEQFGRLLAVKTVGKDKQGHYIWLCKCECGNEICVPGTYLTRGDTRSCGCLHSEVLVQHNKSQKKRESTAQRNRVYSRVHGGWGSRLYKVWCSMKARCCNPKNPSYKDYGGRGITICDEWLHDFAAFEMWASANGYDERASFGMCTLDRVDVDGNYEPSNCRWVSMAEQNKNKRSGVK